MRRTMIAAAVMLLAAQSQAAPKVESKPAASKRTVVKFDGDTIDGDLVRPDGDLVAVRPELALPNLVQPPKSFDRAARATLLAAAAAARPQGEAKKASESSNADVETLKVGEAANGGRRTGAPSSAR